MAIIKEIKGNELYLWMNGNLIYKRWLDTGQSKVFDVMAYDKYTHTSFVDLDLSKSPEIVSVLARLKMKKTEEGGRNRGFYSGYRPNHIFEYRKGRISNTYLGEIILKEEGQINPGEEKIVIVNFLFHLSIEKYLNLGRKWYLHEGINLVGEAEMLEILE
jgi:hypothetical protein